MTAQFNQEERLEMTHIILALFDKWGLKPEQSIILLGLPANTRARELKRYGAHIALNDDAETLKRIECFIEIENALLTTFPHNHRMGSMWLVTANRRFDNLSPLEVMLTQGLDGIYKVRGHLDCTFNWI
jgi:hypothetical protein